MSQDKTEEFIDDKKRQEGKLNSLKDAAAVNATAGFGDYYINAFAIAIKASANQIGLLASLPNLLAPISQLYTSRLMERMSRKKIFSIAIFLQGLMWIPIILTGLLYFKGMQHAPLFLVIFYTIYIIFGNFAMPAWSSWIGDLIEKKDISNFFSLRSRIGSVTALVALIIGGFALDFFKNKTEYHGEFLLFAGFAILFFLAMIFRLLSRHYVLKQYEPKFRFKKKYYFSFRQFVKEAPKRNYGNFALYSALIVMATNVAGPYYSLYMLRNLQFSYIQFMLTMVASTVGTFFFMPLWSKFSDQYGNVNTLRISGFLIPLMCFFWPISVFLLMPLKFYFLLGTSFFGGFAWAGFNLASASFVYDAATPERRSLCVAYSNVLNGLGVVLGTTIGGLLISALKISFIDVIMFVSLVSGIARYGVSFLMVSRITEVREIEKEPTLRVVPLFSQLINIPLYAQNLIIVMGGIPRIIIKKTFQRPD